MAEDFKHIEQTCLELLKMVDAISLAIEQLREQQSNSIENDLTGLQSFADNYTRKMLEDNEINMLKFLGRFFYEKEKLLGVANISSNIQTFPTLGQWLKIVGVNKFMTGDSSRLNIPMEDILKPNGNEILEKFCLTSSFKSPESSVFVLRIIQKATENLKYCLECLKSGGICDSERLSWSHTEPASSHMRNDHNSSSVAVTSKPYNTHLSKASLGATGIRQTRVALLNEKNTSAAATDLITQLGVESNVISPLQTSTSLRPPIAAVVDKTSPPASTVNPRRSLPRESVNANPSDAEEQLALRTWKDIDGVTRRYSSTQRARKRKGLWNKFMTWSSRRNLRSQDQERRVPERTPSEAGERPLNIGPPRRLKSDPGEGKATMTISPSKLVARSTPYGVTSPTAKCMIHMFTTHRIFLAKCDFCQRPMAFSCLVCPLCKFRAHSSCASNLPQIPMFAKPSVPNHSRVTSSSHSPPSPQIIYHQSPPPVTIEPLSPPSPPPSPPTEFHRSMPHAETIAESAVNVVTGLDSELGMAASSPDFPKSASYFARLDNQKENDLEYSARDRKDSVDSLGSTTGGGIFVFGRRNTAYVEGANPIVIPNTVPEEDLQSPISSPDFQNQSYSARSHIDSIGSSATHEYSMTSPPPFLNSSESATYGFGEVAKQSGRRPTRMSTFSEWSVALKEWLIPFSEISRDPQPIARGRYTTVYKGDWHGDVAVKVFHGLDEEDGECSKKPFFSSEQLVRTFKDEVSILLHTRHDNLVLFQGASIDNEQLVIMSTWIKGRTLDSLIYSGNNGVNCRTVGGSGSGAVHHVTSPQGSVDSFSIHLQSADSILFTATQIAQAVAYLHNKGILHKDLRLRNIFIESNGRVLLSDYGIFNVTRLATNRHADVLFVSRSWLFCLAPELARKLSVSTETFVRPDMELPFSEQTDVFSFGCVWFELLHRKPPVSDTREDPHVLIYERGKCRVVEAKSPPVVMGLPIDDCHELLANCWAENPVNRPRFADLILSIEKLSPLLATATANGFTGGGLAAAVVNNHKRTHLGSSHRFAHQPVRSPSQPLRGGSRGNRTGLPFAYEQLTVSDEMKK